MFSRTKNWTHVKKFVGYLRYDTDEELKVLNDLYQNELRLYKNFFQPVMKLILKERIVGKIHRRYDRPSTPYQRIMQSKEISEEIKLKLKQIYVLLNPAELKRIIDAKLDKLYKAYQQKDKLQKVEKMIMKTKKLKPTMVSFLIAQPAIKIPVLVS